MALQLFGTDGIRAEANIYPLTVDIALKIGRGLSVMLQENRTHSPDQRPLVIIGKDTRQSGDCFEQALAAGLNAMGCDVRFAGHLPTPGIAFLVNKFKASAGVVISASHNVHTDNGLKIFNHKGCKLSAEQSERLESLVLSSEFPCPYPHASKIGTSSPLVEADDLYVEHLKSLVPTGFRLDDMAIVLDCAHGAAYKVAPRVLRDLGAKVTCLGHEPNGRNINDGVGSLHPEKAQAMVRKENAACGILLDGDADRVIMIDSQGEPIDGDALMALLAIGLKESGKLAGNTLVATIMSNAALRPFLASYEIDLVCTNVGDRFVWEQMQEKGFSLGGEQSGHIIFAEHGTTGDGLLAALNALVLLKNEPEDFYEVLESYEPLPQVLNNRPVAEKIPMQDLTSTAALIRDIESFLGDEGRVLVRYSGTENKIRILVEGKNQEAIAKYSDSIGKLATQEIANIYNQD